MQEKKKSSKDN